MARGSSMSDAELAQLGVSRSKDQFGKYVYTVPCVICGLPVYTRAYSTTKMHKCMMCKKEIVSKRKAKVKAERERVEEIMAYQFDTDAEHLHRFEQGTTKFGLEYERSINTARKAINDFDSISEVVACIELLHIGTRVIVHQDVGDFTVDFCLPTEKVVVEVDGDIYHADDAKEQMRDYAIMHMLGDGWIVRHIPADAVAKRPKAFGIGMRKMLNARRRDMGIDELKSA